MRSSVPRRLIGDRPLPTAEPTMTIKTSYQPGEPCWADLATPDMDSTIAFYGGLFGWEADESRGEEFGGYRRFLKDGKAVAGVMPLMSPEQPAVWSCHVA